MNKNIHYPEDKLILKKLASYTGVAAAAMLLLPANSHAEIKYYDPDDILISNDNRAYDIDINKDNITDFQIALNTSSYISTTFYTYYYSSMNMRNIINGNLVVANNDFISKLSENMYIGPTAQWDNAAVFCEGTGSYFDSTTRGNWTEDAYKKFIGIKFKISGEDHYGWIRASVYSKMYNMVVTIHDWAYEDKPGVPIKAGQTGNSSY